MTNPFIDWANRRQAEYREARIAWLEAIGWPVERRKRVRKPEPGTIEFNSDPEG